MPAALLAQGPAQAKEIWAIRQQLSVGKKVRDLAMFNCALDAKLRAYAPARPQQVGEHRQVLGIEVDDALEMSEQIDLWFTTSPKTGPVIVA